MERTPAPGVALGTDGDVCVHLADDFYKNAAECLERSRAARTVEAQAEWLSMADFWFQLAQQTEQREGGAPSADEGDAAAQPAVNAKAGN